MDNGGWIENIVSLYFKDGNTKQIAKIAKQEHKEDVLKKIAQAWEEKAKKAPVMESRGWKFQQAKLM
ncbi:hypothetical protein ACJDU8_12810 [Clostridium sp. WILCCON 0269]|uniref:Uncharacterized protein n=1 Tax=Candidatus Clostridium eludens TaxID=3381663 RepID=A0ABW8SK86_9CLOT